MNERTAKLCIPEAKRLKELHITDNWQWNSYDFAIGILGQVVNMGYIKNKRRSWTDYIPIPNADWALQTLAKNCEIVDIYQDSIQIQHGDRHYNIPLDGCYTKALLKAVIAIAEQGGK